MTSLWKPATGCMLRHRVLNMMTHVDPWKRPDLDHQPPPARLP